MGLAIFYLLFSSLFTAETQPQFKNLNIRFEFYQLRKFSQPATCLRRLVALLYLHIYIFLYG